MAAFHFELVSPEKLVFSGEVDQIVVPGSEGDFTVLANHAPVMTSLRPGIVTIESGAGAQRLFVRGGFADVAPAGLTILAEVAVPVADFNAVSIANEIDAAKADAAAAATDEARRLADEKVGQLEQIKADFKL